MRHTSSHTKNRRSHHALTATSIVKDKESGALRLPHRLDESTGMYRGKLIVAERKKEIKEETKRRERNQEEQADVEGTKEPMHAKDENLPAGKAGKPVGMLGRMTKGRANSRSGTGS